MSPTAQAARTVGVYEKNDDIQALFEELARQSLDVKEASLGRVEAMLVAQAHTLDAIFNNLVRKAERTERMDYFESCLRLGLRAQAQCRATLEALNEMKNPRAVSFVQQANIAQGHQQVNNQTSAPRAAKEENPRNELLEQNDGERLDTGTTGTASGTNSPLEAVGAVNRATNGRGEGDG